MLISINKVWPKNKCILLQYDPPQQEYTFFLDSGHILFFEEERLRMLESAQQGDDDTYIEVLLMKKDQSFLSMSKDNFRQQQKIRGNFEI